MNFKVWWGWPCLGWLTWGTVAGPVGPSPRTADVIFKADNREQRQNCQAMDRVNDSGLGSNLKLLLTPLIVKGPIESRVKWIHANQGSFFQSGLKGQGRRSVQTRRNLFATYLFYFFTLTLSCFIGQIHSNPSWEFSLWFNFRRKRLVIFDWNRNRWTIGNLCPWKYSGFVYSYWDRLIRFNRGRKSAVFLNDNDYHLELVNPCPFRISS